MDEPRGSEPGKSRPVLIIQAPVFNQSRLRTVIVAAITTNLGRAEAPGNVWMAAASTGLPKDSVVNVTQIFVVDRAFLRDRSATLPARIMAAVDEGLRLVLAL